MGQYNGSLTREQFMFREMRIVAGLYQSGATQEETLERVCAENLFQYPTEREIRGKCRTALKRLMYITIEPVFIDMLANGAPVEAKQVALLAMMCQSSLVADFMVSVIGNKYRLLDMTITRKDLNLFFADLCAKDEGVAGWSQATIRKIQSVLLNILHDNGYIENTRSEILCPVLISMEFEQALRNAGFQAYLPAFNVLD